ncbi:MAG: amino acid ABC transporter ATP-binding protein [Rhizobiaceae bacterium]|nr:amino acid ABC transporter ATP-binding protein [Rhizobiaceae bacterium]
MLAVTAIEKSFGGIRALSDASLDCAPGEIVGLIGPNGAGKSTLVNVITGFLKPDRGLVKLGDRDITGLNARAVSSAGIARTFQNLRIFGNMTVRQNVEVAHSRCRQLDPVKAARVDPDTLLEIFDLAALANALAGALPYGSQRWLEIARAMATVPDFLILDEPAAGLNDEETLRLAAAIDGIRSDMGTGILVIDHDLHFINRICKRLFVFDQGSLITSGTPEAVWIDPRVVEVYVGAGAPSSDKSLN